MSWVNRLKDLTSDPVRIVQLFMLCRLTGVIASSIVIARSLSVGDVGVVEMLMLCGYLMTFFWSDALLKGYLAGIGEKDDKKTASTFLWFYLVTALLAMAILVLGQKIILPLFVNRSSLDGLGLFALYQALIIPVWVSPFIGLLKGHNLLLLCMYVLIGPAFSCWAGLMNIPDISGVIIGLLSYALVGFAWVLTTTSFVRQLRLKEMMLRLWPATWPLVMYSVSAGIARSFDSWLVARHFDESSFAIFRYGAREFPLVMAFAAGLSTIMISKLKENAALSELKMRSSRLMHLCYPIVAVLMFFSPLLFEYFFGKEYVTSAFIFNIYLLLTITQLAFPQSLLSARGDARWMWYISLAELAVNVITSLILLRYFGLLGIAWGTLIAFIFEKVLLFSFVNYKYNIRPSNIINIRIWAGYAVVLVLVFIVTQWIFGI